MNLAAPHVKVKLFVCLMCIMWDTMNYACFSYMQSAVQWEETLVADVFFHSITVHFKVLLSWYPQFSTRNKHEDLLANSTIISVYVALISLNFNLVRNHVCFFPNHNPQAAAVIVAIGNKCIFGFQLCII